MWWLALWGSAMAQTPGGYRATGATPASEVGVRCTTSIDASGAWVVQPTLRGRGVHEVHDVRVQLPMAIADLDQVRAGPGQLRLGWLRNVETGHDRYLAFGLEAGVPTWPPAQPPAWGELQRDMVAGADAMFVIEWSSAVPEMPQLTVRSGIGWRFASHHRTRFIGVNYPLAELTLALVVPGWRVVDLVFEGELVADPALATTRGLLRFDLGTATLDLGAQVPLFDYAPPGPIAQLRWVFS